MTETDVSKLEPTCAEVDVKWMALRGWVQVRQWPQPLLTGACSKGCLQQPVLACRVRCL